MIDVLRGPLAIAALVVAIAAVAKLRAPETAASALATLRLPGGRGLVRAAAALELVLGIVCVGWPGRWPAAALAGAYGVFTGAAVLLARGRASCGCFGGAGETPVTGAHAGLSALLGATCAAAAVFPPPAVLAGGSVALVVGVVGAAYAVVLAYTELPAAWSAWSA
jgi:hypothetical protein